MSEAKKLSCSFFFSLIIPWEIILFFIVLNSRSSSSFIRFSESELFILNVSKSSSIGTSVFILASFLDNIASSAFSLTLSPTDPVILSLFFSIPSTESYSDNNFCAVLGPTPRIPGILSTLSPCKPKKSMTWSTLLILNFWRTSLTPRISTPLPMNAGLYRKTLWETSWAKSLSGVIIYTVVLFCFDSFDDTVPITSSASNPSFSKISIFKYWISCLIIGIATWISSGCLSLFALYSENISDLKVGAFVSKAIAIWVGSSLFNNSRRVFKKP